MSGVLTAGLLVDGAQTTSDLTSQTCGTRPFLSLAPSPVSRNKPANDATLTTQILQFNFTPPHTQYLVVDAYLQSSYSVQNKGAGFR